MIVNLGIVAYQRGEAVQPDTLYSSKLIKKNGDASFRRIPYKQIEDKVKYLVYKCRRKTQMYSAKYRRIVVFATAHDYEDNPNWKYKNIKLITIDF